MPSTAVVHKVYQNDVHKYSGTLRMLHNLKVSSTSCFFDQARLTLSYFVCVFMQSVHSKPEASVAFPAGWNNSTPWYMTGAQPKPGSANGSGNGGGQQPNAPTAVKPTMPPPAFPAQPWQGSRLGPLPPIYPLPSDAPNATNEVSRPYHLNVIAIQSTQAMYKASGLIHTVMNDELVAVILQAAMVLGNGAGAISEAKSDTSQGQQQQQQPQPQQPHQLEVRPSEALPGTGPIADAVRKQVGNMGFNKIRFTMMNQQDLLHQQVCIYSYIYSLLAANPLRQPGNLL